MPSSSLLGHFTHMDAHTCRQNTYIHKKIKPRKASEYGVSSSSFLYINIAFQQEYDLVYKEQALFGFCGLYLILCRISHLCASAKVYSGRTAVIVCK